MIVTVIVSPVHPHPRGDNVGRHQARPARPVELGDELTMRQVRLNLGGSVYDPTDPVGRLLFNVLAMVAEFEPDLIRLCTREGMKVAKAKGRFRVGSSSESRSRGLSRWIPW